LADLGTELDDFRSRVRSWLELNAPDHRLVGQELEKWAATLQSEGFLCPAWPKEYGGGGLSGVQIAVMNEEFRRAHVPRPNRGMGESLVGPSIILHGTEEQKGYFLPRILSNTDRYCQGFSEPDAGSDLASLKTRGEMVDGEVIVTGQKVWTSWYTTATMLFCLCRTDPDAPKHQGISYVLLPIQNNGIEFRPIKQMSGESHFAETFIDGARAPLFNVIGGINNGWKATMTTLGNERGGNAMSQHLPWERAWHALVDDVRDLGLSGDPVVRQQLAWCYLHVHLMRVNGLRTISALAGGHDPGPSASINKMFWSEYSEAFTELAANILGPRAIAGEQLPRWTQQLLGNRSNTIWGGTAEVQRNIVAERILGLPKDP
jgi:alkylation response protein AidB-like acyl-CoA dehydrogenase